MKIRSSLIIVSLIFSLSCRKTSSPPPGPPATTQPSPVSQLDHSQGGTAPVVETRHFKGSIGTSLDLQMKLVRTGDQLAGSYYYRKSGRALTCAETSIKTEI
jgi:hypothetical protein